MKLKSGYILLALAATALAVLFAACSEDSDGPFTSIITGSLVNQSECGGFPTMTLAPDVPSDQTAAFWSYDGHGTLQLWHLNAAFNCCPNISCRITAVNNTITVEEMDEGMCDCLCLTDVVYEVKGLSAGTYYIKFKEMYLVEGDELLEFPITVGSEPASGEIFVYRDHYPWMPADGGTIGVLKDYSDCGGFDDERFGFYPLVDSTCVLWDYNDNTLLLRHLNAFFNCCLDYIQVQITVNENSILIRESEHAPNPCFCLCPYDVDMEIYNLSPDVYNMLILAPDCTEFWATLDLIQEPEGSECFYPVLIEPGDQ